jgi:hypothetical protein
VRTYLFKLIFSKEEAAEVMEGLFARELVDEWVRQLPVDDLTDIFGVDEALGETDI